LIYVWKAIIKSNQFKLNFTVNDMSNTNILNINTNMNTIKKYCFYYLVLILTLLWGCTTLEIASYWRNREVKIDGNNEDWDGKTWVIKDLKNVLVGFMNDENYLYISLTISDRALQRQIAMRGLTVWFDRNGGDEKKFGVHYPFGMDNRDKPMEGRRPKRDDEHERDSMPIFLEKFSDELDILTPTENEHHRMQMQETGGIDIALNFSQGLLIYEMKVPITDKGAQPYVIGTTAGSIIGVGIETMKNEVPADRAERPMRGEESGRSGYGGRRGGGDRSSGERRVSEPLKLWAKIKLAIPDSTIIH
jgi:hypothetical protein